MRRHWARGGGGRGRRKRGEAHPHCRPGAPSAAAPLPSSASKIACAILEPGRPRPASRSGHREQRRRPPPGGALRPRRGPGRAGKGLGGSGERPGGRLAALGSGTPAWATGPGGGLSFNLGRGGAAPVAAPRGSAEAGPRREGREPPRHPHLPHSGSRRGACGSGGAPAPHRRRGKALPPAP